MSNTQLASITPSNPHTGEEIRPLRTTFNQSGWAFRQLERVKQVAIYEKTKRAMGGPSIITSWEVVVITKKKADPRFGGFSGFRECYPGSERWGEAGWTCLSLERAREKMRELLGNPRES